jgi:hypothetical protein
MTLTCQEFVFKIGEGYREERKKGKESPTGDRDIEVRIRKRFITK